MAKKKHWYDCKDEDEKVSLMIEEGYPLSFICQITAKSEEFVQQIAEKYELSIRREPAPHDKMYWLKKNLGMV